jgi:hypothetical protein
MCLAVLKGLGLKASSGSTHRSCHHRVTAEAMSDCITAPAAKALLPSWRCILIVDVYCNVSGTLVAPADVIMMARPDQDQEPTSPADTPSVRRRSHTMSDPYNNARDDINQTVGDATAKTDDVRDEGEKSFDNARRDAGNKTDDHRDKGGDARDKGNDPLAIAKDMFNKLKQRVSGGNR